MKIEFDRPTFLVAKANRSRFFWPSTFYSGVELNAFLQVRVLIAGEVEPPTDAHLFLTVVY